LPQAARKSKKRQKRAGREVKTGIAQVASVSLPDPFRRGLGTTTEKPPMIAGGSKEWASPGGTRGGKCQRKRGFRSFSKTQNSFSKMQREGPCPWRNGQRYPDGSNNKKIGEHQHETWFVRKKGGNTTPMTASAAAEPKSGSAVRQQRLIH